MKLRSIEFLLVSTVAALSIAALLQSTEVSRFAFATFSYLLFLTAIPMAIGKQDGKRAFWTGFLITGVLYLGFAYMPDSDGFSPRQEGSEFTTRLSILAFDKLEDLDSKIETGSNYDQSTHADPEQKELGCWPSPNSETSSSDADNPFGAGGLNMETELSYSWDVPSKENDEESDHTLAEKEAVNFAESGPGFGGRPSSIGNDFENKFEKPGITEADFQPLIDLIQETVGTEDWEDNNGVGEIQAFPVNLCGGIIVHSPESRNFSNFIAISHSAWALMLAWIVGKFSRYSWDLGSK